MSTEQVMAVMSQVKLSMLAMYGVESIDQWYDNSIEWVNHDNKMLLASMLSDVQEMNERGMVEEARVTLNRAKWLVAEHL